MQKKAKMQVLDGIIDLLDELGYSHEILDKDSLVVNVKFWRKKGSGKYLFGIMCIDSNLTVYSNDVADTASLTLSTYAQCVTTCLPIARVNDTLGWLEGHMRLGL